MKINKKFIEILSVIAVIFAVIVLQRDIWITGKRMFTADSIIWFGVFAYFSDCLQQWVLPLWNPYMNCGEVFFLNIDVLHLWDPGTLFLVFAGKFLKIDTLTIYHFDLLLRYLIFILGGYLFFRRLAKYKISALVAFISLAFSSLASMYLKQHGVILCFYLLPWILLCIFKLFETEDPAALIGLAFLGGVTFYTGYHAMYLVSSVGTLLACIFLTKWALLPKLCRILKHRVWVSLSILFFLLIVVNLIPVYLKYNSSTVPTVRMFECPGPANSYFSDFFTLLAPHSFWLHLIILFFDSTNPMSEVFLYVGLVPIFLAIVGLLYSRQRYKVGFTLALGLTALLMLGPNFLAVPLFSLLIPYFSIIRNTHIFGTFFIFCLTYFVCLGLDYLMELAESSALSRHRNRFILIAALIASAALFIANYILKIYAMGLQLSSDKYQSISAAIGQDLSHMLRGGLSKSYHHIWLFIIAISVILYLLEKPKISLKIKYFTLIAFILVDLVLFNQALYDGITSGPRVDMSNWAKESTAYSDYRAPVMQPKWPFFGFAPALLRKFTAESTRIPSVTTHFYEMKDYFRFVNDDQIDVLAKNVFMGVSQPRLKLINAGVVMPAVLQAGEFKKISQPALNCAIFIEEELPEKFQKLKISVEEINQARIVQGQINVLSFDPNSLLLEVDSPEDSFLYYSDVFDKDWRVFIDGKENKVYRTNLAFKSVLVEKGSHRVSWVYDPVLYKITLYCYFAGIFLAVIGFIYILLKRRKRR